MSWINKTSQGSAIHETASTLSIASLDLVRETNWASLNRVSTDTLSSKKTDHNESNNSFEKVVLPKASTNSGNGDYLMDLAEAFGKIYTSMSDTVQDQITGQQALIQMDQAVSECVMKSTDNSINDLNANNQKVADLEAEQAKGAKDTEIWGKVSFVMTVFLIAGSVALAIATGGASAAVEAPLLGEGLAEGTELLSAAEEGGLGASQTSLGELGSLPEESSVDELGGLSDETNAFSPLDDDMWSETSSISDENEPLELEKQVEKSSEGAEKAKAVLKTLSKGLMGGGLGTISAMPNIMQAKSSFAIAKFQHQLSGLLATMGPAQAGTQENNMYYQFYQQLVQRGAQIIQQLGEQASSAVEIDGTIMGAYRQIAISLAQSA